MGRQDAKLRLGELCDRPYGFKNFIFGSGLRKALYGRPFQRLSDYGVQYMRTKKRPPDSNTALI